MLSPSIRVYLHALTSKYCGKKLTMVFRGVDSYLPRFSSSHGQSLLPTPQHFEHVTT